MTMCGLYMYKCFAITHLPEHLRLSSDKCFEIQQVDSFGQTLDYDYFGEEDSSITLCGEKVPERVLYSAKLLSIGESQYIDENGDDTSPTKQNFNPSLQGQIGQIRFFILHLSRDWERAKPSRKFEIQLVNESGQAILWGHFGDDELSLVIGDFVVPSAVVQAARRLPEGVGEYVDEFGKPIHFADQ
jgi:hypothetical protein